MSMIKQKILEMADPGEEVVPKEFDNLILDDVTITQFSTEDKAYLEEFVNMDLLGLNCTKLNSLKNFPNAPKLARLELNENFIKGEDLVNLKHLGSLTTLKLANNQIVDLESLNHIKCLASLKNLDLIQNPITETGGYRDKVFEMFPNLEVLDQKNRDGEEIFSEDDDDAYGDEEGEEDMDENGDPAFLANMTEEQKQKLRDQGIDLRYLEGDDGDFDDDEAEYGEDDLSEGYGDEEGSGPANRAIQGGNAEENFDDDEDDEDSDQAGAGGPSKRPKTQ